LKWRPLTVDLLELHELRDVRLLLLLSELPRGTQGSGNGS
jgi:hypothetical protein